MSVKLAKSAHFLEVNSSKFGSTALLKVEGQRALKDSLERKGDLVVGDMACCRRSGIDPTTENRRHILPKMAGTMLRDEGE